MTEHPADLDFDPNLLPKPADLDNELVMQWVDHALYLLRCAKAMQELSPQTEKAIDYAGNALVGAKAILLKKDC